MLNMKYEYECFICTLFFTSQKVILRIFNTYKIFHRAIATYKDGKKSSRTQLTAAKIRSFSVYLHLDGVSCNLPAPALIILFDIFRERVNQIEYNQWEESAPALLVSTENGGYTCDPLHAPAYSRR